MQSAIYLMIQCGKIAKFNLFNDSLIQGGKIAKCRTQHRCIIFATDTEQNNKGTFQVISKD